MICQVCGNEFNNLNKMNVCNSCDNTIQKRLFIKNSSLSINKKNNLINNIDNYTLNELKNIVNINKSTISSTQTIYDKFIPTQKIENYLWIDKNNKLWCPNPKTYLLGKNSGLLNYDKCKIFKFEDIISFEIRENGQIIESSTKGGLKSAIIGDFLGGDIGAIIGSNVGKRNTISKTITNYKVFVYLKNNYIPSISINCDNSIDTANLLAGAFSQIITILNDEKSQKEKIREKAQKTNENILTNELIKATSANSSPISIADEILKYKKLLDSGIISENEFEKLKSKLINS